MSKTFLYFAYGSNLFTKRIHINNPTAVRKDIGFLKNYRLDFARYSKRWHGASATIVPAENYKVWGVVWEIDQCNLPALDNQEGVNDGIYLPLTVAIETVNGSLLKCRVYQQCNNPTEYFKLALLPEDRQPSPLYLETILKGAQENSLPKDYIDLLEKIPNNGYKGTYDIGLSLNEV